MGAPHVDLAQAAMPETEHYVVKKGDTLGAIARSFGLDYRELAKWNDIADPSRIEIGQRLRLSPPEPQETVGESATAARERGRPLPPGAAAQPVTSPAPATEAAPARQQQELAQLRATTATLIELLLSQGVITREKAEELMQQAQLGPLPPAEQRAAAQAAEDAAPGQQPHRTAQTSVEASDADSAEPGVVRVPYVPEIVKNEIRDQIREEVIAQAKAERWAEPSALPEWLDRITWEGDFRARFQRESYDSGNTPASDYALNALGGVTRAAELAATTDGLPTGNTTEDRDRWRLRLRLGMLARVTDRVGVGVRLATGNTNDRVSTNQSLGQDFNKYTLVVDRAYVRVDPWDWLSVSAGRMPNPWFATDLMWDEDLNFEGLAATLRPSLGQGSPFGPFLTAGAFPMRENSPPTADDRWLYGAQAGVQWDVSSETRLKFGLGYFPYRNLAGRQQSAANFLPGFGPLTPDYGQYEYPSSLRQKGNTLFRTNAPNDLTGDTIWGLASEFEPLSLTASLDLAQFDPIKIGLVGEYVQNLAFDREEILERTGVDVIDGSSIAYQLRLNVNRGDLRDQHDWQAYLAYKHIGSDALLDGFADSDFGLGGTNLKGYVLGFNYAVYRHAYLTFKWLSADSIDPYTLKSGDKFGVDVLQLDFTARF